MANHYLERLKNTTLFEAIKTSPVLSAVVALSLYVLADIGITSIKTNQYDQFVSQQAQVYASGLSTKTKIDSLETLTRDLKSWFPGIGPFSIDQTVRNNRLARVQLDVVESKRELTKQE